jgi:hypothetical protein
MVESRDRRFRSARDLREACMTGTDAVETIAEALALIDRGLGDMQHRELVSTDEVADLLLDVRVLLVAPGTDPEQLDSALTTN